MEPEVVVANATPIQILSKLEDVIVLLTSLTTVFEPLGVIADLTSLAQPFAESYDRALMLGQQLERNEAAFVAYAEAFEHDESWREKLLMTMEIVTGGGVAESALEGMAAQTMAWGVTGDATDIAELVQVAWVRGGISPSGGMAGETATERTAAAFMEILDAIARGDMGFLKSRGFIEDETAFAGLTGDVLVDRLVDAVTRDPVTLRLLSGRETSFDASAYESETGLDTELVTDFGRKLSRAGSKGFWPEHTWGALWNDSVSQILLGLYEAADESPAAEGVISTPALPSIVEPTGRGWLGARGQEVGALAGLTTDALLQVLQAEQPQWLADTNQVVAAILQQVQAGITPEVVEALALRLFPDGLPGQRRPVAHDGVQSMRWQRGIP